MSQAKRENIASYILTDIHIITIDYTTKWTKAGRGGRVDSMSARCAGGLPIEFRHPTSATSM